MSSLTVSRGISKLSLAGLVNLPNLVKIANLHIREKKKALKYT